MQRWFCVGTHWVFKEADCWIIFFFRFWHSCLFFMDVSAKGNEACKFNNFYQLFLVGLFSRLCAGCDQTYHLTRRAQDGRSGWGQYSHCAERCAWRSGVPTQEWTDPQVRCPPGWCRTKTWHRAFHHYVCILYQTSTWGSLKEEFINLCQTCRLHCSPNRGFAAV